MMRISRTLFFLKSWASKAITTHNWCHCYFLECIIIPFNTQSEMRHKKNAFNIMTSNKTHSSSFLKSTWNFHFKENLRIKKQIEYMKIQLMTLIWLFQISTSGKMLTLTYQSHMKKKYNTSHLQLPLTPEKIPKWKLALR